MALFSQRVATLILKNLRREMTLEEQQELQTWVEADPENEKLFHELTNEESLQNALVGFYKSDENVWGKILAGIEEKEPLAPVKKIRPFRYVAAASVTILFAAGVFWWSNKNTSDTIAKTSPTHAVGLEDILAPSGNNSSLTLGNGKVILLDSTGNGMLAQQGYSSVVKSDTALLYEISATKVSNAAPEWNTLRTQRGGQQRLILPDGSSIFLNTASAITFPNVFTGNERRVKISGEAAFKIKSIPREGGNGKLPFIVEILSSNGDYIGEVEVLGTYFAINSYDDETVVKTTLVEGSVRMHNRQKQSVILAPGQQAQLNPTGNLKVINSIDPESALAFTTNMFSFESADIETIFRELSRWYPITVEFPQGKPKDTYTGSIPRTVSLANLLDILSISELKFKIENGNKLIVVP